MPGIANILAGVVTELTTAKSAASPVHSKATQVDTKVVHQSPHAIKFGFLSIISETKSKNNNKTFGQV